MLAGKKASAYIYCIEVLLPFVWVAICTAFGIFPWWSIIVVAALKPAMENARKAMEFPGKGMGALTGVDEMTAKLQLMFSLLLTVSFLIDKLLQ